MNQANLLKYMAKYRKATAPELYGELRRRAGEVLRHVEELRGLEAATIDEVRFQLLSVEGRAAQQYWAAIKEVAPAELNWPGRRTRGARDGLNSALNYGYGILYGQVERALCWPGWIRTPGLLTPTGRQTELDAGCDRRVQAAGGGPDGFGDGKQGF